MICTALEPTGLGLELVSRVFDDHLDCLGGFEEPLEVLKLVGYNYARRTMGSDGCMVISMIS